MVAVFLSPFGGAGSQFFDNNGVILSGGKIYSYVAGTTTPQATYTSSTGAVPHSNPIILDSAGRVPSGEIWLTDGVAYKFVLETSASILLGTYDNIEGIQDSSALLAYEAALASTSGASLVGYSTYDGSPSTVAAFIAATEKNIALNFTTAPTVQPTCAVGSAGVINGTCSYMITYVTATGETDTFGNSSPVTPVNQSVNLSNIQVSSDARVIARRIYRTPAGAVDFVLGKLVATINDNTTTTYTDNIADSALGVAVPRINLTGGLITANGQTYGSANSGSTRLGQTAMPNTTSYASTAVGSRALAAITTGFRNTAIGVDAMDGATTAFESTAVGVHALGNNVTGRQNTAVGYQALQFGVSGNFNNAFGTGALALNTGDDNIAIGNQALQLHTTGNGNVAIGRSALTAAGNGSGNTAVGNSAGNAEGTGNFNTFLGTDVAKLASGQSLNTAVGAFALNALVSGSGNVALGSFAGYYETGPNSLWIDNQTRANLADAKIKALLWGAFNTTVAGQQLTINGLLNANGGIATPYSVQSGSYTMLATDGNITFSGATTLTLIAPFFCPGRIIVVRNTAAAAVVSASSNVVPLAGGAAGTAILAATAGKFAMLQSDGSNWQIMMAN